jgi:hypothetical protein
MTPSPPVGLSCDFAFATEQISFHAKPRNLLITQQLWHQGRSLAQSHFPQVLRALACSPNEYYCSLNNRLCAEPLQAPNCASTLAPPCSPLPSTDFSNRFGSSSLHQRDPRSALFENYSGGASGGTRNSSASPSRPGGYGGGYGYSGAANDSASLGNGLGTERPGYRPATPNSRYRINLNSGESGQRMGG